MNGNEKREWRDVVGYEGLYVVSNDGYVKGVKTGKILKFSHTYNGYPRVKLYMDAKGKEKLVHRIVADAFVDNHDNKPQVNHKNGIKSDNHIGNLEWVTQSENLSHAAKSGLIDISKMTSVTSKRVIQKDMGGKILRIWDSMSEAAREMGLQVANISNCCSGRIKSTGGYKWNLEI